MSAVLPAREMKSHGFRDGIAISAGHTRSIATHTGGAGGEMIMNWLAQNWIWILLGLGVLVVLGRGRYGRGGLSHYGSGGMAHGGTGYDQATHGSQPSGGYSQPSIQPGIAIDPVTRQDVSTATALTSIYQGRIYYFTSAESRQRFEASPAQYAREGLGHSLGPAQSAEPPPRRRGGGC